MLLDPKIELFRPFVTTCVEVEAVQTNIVLKLEQRRERSEMSHSSSLPSSSEQSVCIIQNIIDPDFLKQV